MSIVKIYQSNYYTKQINTIIDQCLSHHYDHPFDQHYFIVDDVKYFEEILLKKTDTLFNIDIMSLSDFFKHILYTYHQYRFKKASHFEKIMLLSKLFNQNTDHLFHHSQNHFQTINQLLKVFDQLYLSEANYQNEQLTALSKYKLESVFSLYHQMMSQLENHYDYHDTVMNLFDKKLSHHHYYFITKKINNKKMYKVIQALDQYADVIVYSNDSIFCNHMPVNVQHQDYLDYTILHLFDSYDKHCGDKHPYAFLKATTPKNEVEQVVFHIYQTRIDHQAHNHDFAIYYPNRQYRELLVQTLDQFDIPYYDQKTIIFQEFNALKALIRYFLSHDQNDLIELIHSGCLKCCHDIKQISLIKTLYLKNHDVDLDFYQEFKHQLDALVIPSRLCDLSSFFADFLNDHFLMSDNLLTLINQLKKLDDEALITLKDYISLLDIVILQPQSHDIEIIDSLYLLQYQQPYSEQLDTKYIYLLGMNETVVPQEFKNTGIILNHEAKALHIDTTYDQLQKYQEDLLHVFSNRHESVILSYASQTIDGQDLVISSIVHKLDKLFSITTINVDGFHPALLSNLYLAGGKDQDENWLNQSLDQYQHSHNQVGHFDIAVKPQKLSPTTIEKYNSCPYLYFNRYILQIQPLEIYQFQSHEIGSIVHYVLEKNIHYYNNNQPKDYSHLQDNINHTIDDYLQNNLKDRFDNPINQFFISMIRVDLYNTIIVLSKQMQQGLFHNIACEKNIYDDFHHIPMMGKVDRVDIYQNYLKIIDYKSSQKELDLQLARQGFNIQMLIYLDMLSKTTHYDKGAVLYFNTKKRLLKSELSILQQEDSHNFFKMYQMDGYSLDDVYDDIDNHIDNTSDIIKVRVKKDGCPYSNAKIINSDELDALLNDIAQHIQQLYQNMMNGHIEIYPTRSDNPTIDMKVNPCKFCPYHSLCNYDIFYNEDHKILIGGHNENSN